MRGRDWADSSWLPPAGTDAAGPVAPSASAAAIQRPTVQFTIVRLRNFKSARLLAPARIIALPERIANVRIALMGARKRRRQFMGVAMSMARVIAAIRIYIDGRAGKCLAFPVVAAENLRRSESRESEEQSRAQHECHLVLRFCNISVSRPGLPQWFTVTHSTSSVNRLVKTCGILRCSS